MSNVMKFCGCKYCRNGLRTRRGKAIVKATAKLFRRKCKEQIRRGLEPDTKVSVAYTD